MEQKRGSLKIVFICSSLEPGHDGVGDYTRRLAASLIKNGNKCGIISLNDRQVTSVLAFTQQADGMDVPVMRLPASLPLKQRFAIAKKWVDEFNPQWLSLQFVPFGYHPKGLKLGLGKMLLTLGGGRSWHIMFHELWVGIAREESTKLHWWGAAQRILVKSLVKKLRPDVIHTQTALYKSLLAKLGFEAGYLPLYGNIAVTDKLRAGNLPADKLAFVVFGTIHDKAPISEFAAEAALYAHKNSIPVSLTIIGRGNAEQQRWAAAWENTGLTVNLLGELSEEQISAILNNATIGLSATALAVIEKSGSYAAMREHCLPVISVSKAWTPTGVPLPQIPGGVTKYAPGNFDECIAKSKFSPYQNSVYQVSVKFAEDLNKFKTG